MMMGEGCKNRRKEGAGWLPGLGTEERPWLSVLRSVALMTRHKVVVAHTLIA